jgi:K+-transporting ATPase ATPase C chain
MRRQLLPAVRVLLVLTLLTGLVYPLAVTGVAQLAFPWRADGSRILVDGRMVGSVLQGQPLRGAAYFHPRPSAAGDGYDGAATSGSNSGPTDEAFLTQVAGRADAYRRENRLPEDARVPVDAVTASGSGLDPHISVANARLQAPRVATARSLTVDEVLNLVDEHTTPRTFTFLGEPTVNVLVLNIALDRGA